MFHFLHLHHFLHSFFVYTNSRNTSYVFFRLTGGAVVSSGLLVRFHQSLLVYERSFNLENVFCLWSITFFFNLVTIWKSCCTLPASKRSRKLKIKKKKKRKKKSHCMPSLLCPNVFTDSKWPCSGQCLCFSALQQYTQSIWRTERDVTNQ